jgi:hypothetical protein
MKKLPKECHDDRKRRPIKKVIEAISRQGKETESTFA